MENISDQDRSIDQLSNKFVVIRADQSLQEANSALLEAGGDPDWVLLVQMQDGAYRGASFSAILDWIKSKQRFQIDLSDLLQDSLSPIIPIESYDQSSIDIEIAKQKAGENMYGLVAITAFGDVMWIYTLNQARPEIDSTPPEPGTPDTLIRRELPPATPGFIERFKTFFRKWKIGFIITAFWFVATTIITIGLPLLKTNLSELLPSVFPPVMTGEWNLVVAGFSPLGERSISSEDASHISEVFFNYFASEINSLGTDIGVYVQLLGPGESPQIVGRTAEERERRAGELANKMKADMVVYGTIEHSEGGYLLKPEFYVNVRNFYEASEMVGQHELGSEISLIETGDDFSAQINLNRELSNRSQVLALIAKGLGLFLSHQYDYALDLFTRANEDSLWEIDAGREVVYLFQGNAALRLDLLTQAEEMYLAAKRIDPEYSRAYIGLGEIYYLYALQSEQTSEFVPDLDKLNQALSIFQRAKNANNQPESADIPTKVAFGMGQVYLTQWLIGEDTMDAAVQNFTYVIEEYKDRSNDRVQEIASEAHAHLGLIARQNREIERAIEEYQSAIELGTNPARRGLYWSLIGDIYLDQDNPDAADEAYTSCVSEYTTAIKLSSRTERRSGNWGNISYCYLKQGKLQDAIHAIEQAIKYLPEDSDKRLEYELRLRELQLP